jgi:D-mannonate dehydratase
VERVTTVPVTTTVSDLAMETHPPRPYDIVQGMERVISIMEDTLEICE